MFHVKSPSTHPSSKIKKLLANGDSSFIVSVEGCIIIIIIICIFRLFFLGVYCVLRVSKQKCAFVNLMVCGCSLEHTDMSVCLLLCARVCVPEVFDGQRAPEVSKYLQQHPRPVAPVAQLAQVRQRLLRRTHCAL